jgi:hypothetical protein
VGIVGVVIIVASVILNGMFRKSDDEGYIKKFQVVLENYASEISEYKSHMTEVHGVQPK